MKLIFKKSLTATLFSFVFVLAFLSAGANKAEAVDVPTEAWATESGLTNYSSPLNIVGAKNVDIYAQPSSDATSCIMSGGYKTSGTYKQNDYIKVGTVSVSKTTTFSVTCDYTPTVTYSCAGSYGGNVQTTPVKEVLAPESQSCNSSPGWMNVAGITMCEPLFPTTSYVACGQATSSATCPGVASYTTCSISGSSCTGTISNTSCVWSNNACVPKAGKTTRTVDYTVGSCTGTIPSGAGTCAVQLFTGTGTNCTSQLNQTSCTNNGCAWWPTYIGASCSDYGFYNQQGCTDNQYCNWTPTLTPTVSCVGPTTQSSCTAQSSKCSWVAN